MERTKWVDRQFTFDLPEGWIFNVIERLRGAPIRVENMVTGLSDDQLSAKSGTAWSIKEHIGHLYDLEFLHAGRLDDFLAGEKTLRAADMSNARTDASNHNDRRIEKLVEMFASSRQDLVTKFEQLDDATQRQQALHPRLQVMMRPIDVAYFTAEHDDHHLCWIRQLME